MTSVIVHYQELALKGRNRRWFVRALVRTVRLLLADLDVVHVHSVSSRIEIRFRSGDHWPEVRDRLRRLPGIANFARSVRVPADMDAITTAVMAGLQGQALSSFRIRARRADKRFPVPSPEIERRIGARVHTELGWPVDLVHPEAVIRVEVLTNEAFIIFNQEAGTGGLPIGTGGTAVGLLSGGIDSPVAAWRILRRGVKVQLVHFHSYPILDDTSQEKVRELARILARHQLMARLFLVPLGAVQQHVMVTVPPELRMVIYRRFMLRIAQRIAERVHASALVTGDVIGQVASQTVENIRAIDDAVTMPVLRPLVGFDKSEIVQQAIRLGTYETSITADQDCCSLFAPPYPATRASIEAVRAAEALLDVDALMALALQGTVVEERRYPPRPGGEAPGPEGGPDVTENDKMRRLLVQETTR